MGVARKLKTILARSVRRGRLTRFRDSASYWDERYRRRSDSGDGSYGRLGQFKAEVVNSIVAEMRADSVIEWGSGDGAQLALLQVNRYLGVDVSPTAVETCQRRFAGDASRTFMTLDEAIHKLPAADLALSLDVIYHLVEEDVFDDYMHRLFGSARSGVVIYSSNHEDPETDVPHVRHRQFTDWIDAFGEGWVLHRRICNRYPFNPDLPKNTSFADFFVYIRCQSPDP